MHCSAPVQWCKDEMMACFNKILVVVMTPENQSLKADYPTKANFPFDARAKAAAICFPKNPKL